MRLPNCSMKYEFDLLRVAQVRVFPVAAEDAAHDVVCLVQPAAQAAPPGPIHHRRELALADRARANRALLRRFRRRTHREHARVLGREFLAEAVEDQLLQRVYADQVAAVRFGVACPGGLYPNRLKAHVHLAVLLVEDQHRRLRRLPAQRHERHAQAVEGIGSPAHAGDVKAVPLRAPGAEEQPARAWHAAARQQPLTKGEAVGVQVEAPPAVIDRAEHVGFRDRADIPVPIIEMDRQLALIDWVSHL